LTGRDALVPKDRPPAAGGFARIGVSGNGGERSGADAGCGTEHLAPRDFRRVDTDVAGEERPRLNFGGQKSIPGLRRLSR
jgi:hypothetical protein